MYAETRRGGGSNLLYYVQFISHGPGRRRLKQKSVCRLIATTHAAL